LREGGRCTPSVRTTAGYRRYTDADLQRLHRIVAYRETGLGLDVIDESARTHGIDPDTVTWQ
jgi:DNA-binding transcriptional MerR regulator